MQFYAISFKYHDSVPLSIAKHKYFSGFCGAFCSLLVIAAAPSLAFPRKRESMAMCTYRMDPRFRGDAGGGECCARRVPEREGWLDGAKYVVRDAVEICKRNS